MTLDAGFLRFRVSVAAETGGRVDTSIDPMSAQVIPTMRHFPKGLALILLGGFQLHPGRMAIKAEIPLVAHCTDLLIMIGLELVLLREVDRMIKLFPGKGLIL